MGTLKNKELCEVQPTHSFILGGNSEFTIENLNSGTKYAYRVKVSPNNKNLFFVYTNDITEDEEIINVYAGFLQRDARSGMIRYNRGAKGKLDDDTPQIKGIIYALRAGDQPLKRPMILYHHGRCAKCNRKLTDADSIARGFGPECWKMVKGIVTQKY
jgi:hypothetical protein